MDHMNLRQPTLGLPAVESETYGIRDMSKSTSTMLQSQWTFDGSTFVVCLRAKRKKHWLKCSVSN